MTVGGFVEGRGDNFGVDASAHVGDFLGTFVDQKNHDVGLGVVFSYGVGDIFQKNCLTGLRGGHDQSALSFAYGGEHVNDAGRYVGGAAGGEVEFFVGEEGSQMLERHSVTDKFGRTAVDAVYAGQHVMFFVFARRTDGSFHNIACFKTVGFYLLM